MAKKDLRERLHEAIKKHSSIDDDQIIDAAQHGADAGWPGFTYYKDTVEFYDDNADDIWELVNEMADDYGEDHTLAMISKFGGAKNVGSDETFKNMMSWVALEEVGRWLESVKETEKEE